MSRSIDYWFTLASPWAFLGHQAFRDLARAHGVTVRYKPVQLAEVFPHTGGLPLPKRHPARQRYRILELQRWREARGVALKLHPKHWPLPIALPDRTITAVAESGADPGDYVRRAFEAIWVEDRDLKEDAALVALLDAAGHDGNASCMRRAQSKSSERTKPSNVTKTRRHRGSIRMIPNEEDIRQDAAGHSFSPG